MNILDRSEGLGYVTTSYIIDGKGDGYLLMFLETAEK
jgi:hypothetical protein